ncbi:hypothetical protein K7W11_000441 [Listeria monocytogenes]|nr:hypothetical protein [Listeria monocytogenes]EEO3415810.1 hypothetical protein [Listeria monocytogenes]EHI2457889.1 hypothetical protein [Listeria monocytogenes]EIA8399778.1 hypothetical protein [Listeria monocytogenes]MCZ63510.1 hypothetical protein [Listeria monocytogenes serotype 4b]
MSKYVVLKTFSDLEDGNHIYQEGDKYPRQGKAKKTRIDELSSTSNKLNEPLIIELESDK